MIEKTKEKTRQKFTTTLRSFSNVALTCRIILIRIAQTSIEQQTFLTLRIPFLNFAFGGTSCMSVVILVLLALVAVNTNVN